MCTDRCSVVSSLPRCIHLVSVRFVRRCVFPVREKSAYPRGTRDTGTDVIANRVSKVHARIKIRMVKLVLHR